MAENLETAVTSAAPLKQRCIAIRIENVTVTGGWALALLIVIPALVVTAIIYAKPSLGMLLSGGLWFAFVLNWGRAAKKAPAAKRSEPANSRRFHVLLLCASILLLFLPIPFLTRRFLAASSWMVPAGLSLQAAFFLLAAWSRRHLGRNWGAAVTIKENHQLVRSGPYRVARHPIYTGMLGMALATALVSGSWHALLGFALMAAAYSRKIRMEERILEENFGAAYRDYRKHSWALVPGLF